MADMTKHDNKTEQQRRSVFIWSNTSCNHRIVSRCFRPYRTIINLYVTKYAWQKACSFEIAKDLPLKLNMIKTKPHFSLQPLDTSITFQSRMPYYLFTSIVKKKSFFDMCRSNLQSVYKTFTLVIIKTLKNYAL